MTLTNLSVGIDYHQSTVRVAVLSSSGKLVGSRNLANSVEEVVSYVGGFGSVQGVALEACTGSAHFADELRKASGWSVELCHPGYVQRMRHNPDKSDASDSWLLGDLQRVGYLPKVWLAPEELRDLRTLVRHRWNLVASLKQQKLRVRALLRRERVSLPPDVRNVWSKRGRAWLSSIPGFREHTRWVFEELLSLIGNLEERIARCTKRLNELAKQDALIQELMKHSGVGAVTATLMRAEIGTFTRFRRGKELSRFCGMTPRNASSGAKQADAGLIKAGNPVLRASLIQVGHNLCRFDSTYKMYAAKLLGRGKKKCVVVAAVTNRWLRKFLYEMKEFELQQTQAAA